MLLVLPDTEIFDSKSFITHFAEKNNQGGKKSQREDVFLNILTEVYIYLVNKPAATRE